MRKIAAGLYKIIFSPDNIKHIKTSTLLTTCTAAVNYLGPLLLGKLASSEFADVEQGSVEIAGMEFSKSLIVTGLIGVYALSKILPNYREQQLVVVNENATKTVVNQITYHLVAKKSAQYHVSTSMGTKTYLIQKGFGVTSLILPLLNDVVPTLFEISVASYVLTSRFGLTIGVGLLGTILAHMAYGKLEAPYLMQSREAMLSAGNKAWDAVMKTISREQALHDFNRVDWAMKQVAEVTSSATKAGVLANMAPKEITRGHYVIAYTAFSLAVLTVWPEVRRGELEPSLFIEMVGYLNTLAGLLPIFGSTVNNLIASYPDFSLVFNTLAEQSEIQDDYSNYLLPVDNGDIRFDKVRFTYHDGERKVNRPILNDLSCTIGGGQYVVIVSESGGGKSTMLDLLLRRYEADSGVITIDNTNIRQTSLHDLRTQVAIIRQKPALFNATVRDNILFGAKNSETITNEFIFQVAEQLHLKDFLTTLKLGLETMVGEEGGQLSGGQQQKIAILCTVFKVITYQSKILLCDEITSSLDSKSAEQVLRGLSVLAKKYGLTVLAITHKLHEAVTADRILVLQNGKVTHAGNHVELMQTCPLYIKLYTGQSSSKDQSESKHAAKAPGRVGLFHSQSRLVCSDSQDFCIDIKTQEP